MNLLLLEDGDFVAPDRVRLQGRRLQHLREVHRAECGDSLRVGRLGGLMGRGELQSLNAEQAELQISLDTPPPAKLPLTLLLAVPRPKMLKRVLQSRPSAPWVSRGWCCSTATGWKKVSGRPPFSNRPPSANS